MNTQHELDKRIKIEKQIVTSIIKSAIDLDFSVSLNDGGDWVVSRSTDCKQIVEACFSVDRETLRFYPVGTATKIVGMVDLVYGNNGWDVINDYTDNDTMEEILSPAFILCDELDAD